MSFFHLVSVYRNAQYEVQRDADTIAPAEAHYHRASLLIQEGSFTDQYQILLGQIL